MDPHLLKALCWSGLHHWLSAYLWIHSLWIHIPLRHRHQWGWVLCPANTRHRRSVWSMLGHRRRSPTCFMSSVCRVTGVFFPISWPTDNRKRLYLAKLHGWETLAKVKITPIARCFSPALVIRVFKKYMFFLEYYGEVASAPQTTRVRGSNPVSVGQCNLIFISSSGGGFPHGFSVLCIYIYTQAPGVLNPLTAAAAYIRVFIFY